MPQPARRRGQRRPDHRRLIRPPQQQPRRQQHVRRPAACAPRPPRPDRPARPPGPNTARHPAMPPPGQPSPAHRAAQTALFQHPLDRRRVVAYREHRCSFAPQRPSPRLAKRHGEGRSETDTLTVSSDMKKGNQFRLPDTTLSPEDA